MLVKLTPDIQTAGMLTAIKMPVTLIPTVFVKVLLVSAPFRSPLYEDAVALKLVKPN